MVNFLNGIAATASLIAGAIFLRFWRESHDRLFVWFALAFWMFAANWATVALSQPADETRHYFYAIRLLGLILILAGVVGRNRASGRQP
jgi:hypothetical protein